MTTLANLRDPRRDARIVRQRLWWLVGFMGLAITTVLLRLAVLQFVNFDRYSVLAQDNRIRVLPVAPPRGLVYSRDGLLLAENRPGFSLVINQEKVDDIDAMLAAVSEFVSLGEEDLAAFARARRERGRFEDVVVKSGLTEQEVASFEVNGHRFPGLRVKAELVRHYPHGERFAHLVGYVSSISKTELAEVEASRYAGTSAYGKAGVERAYQDWLHGYPGSQRVEVNAEGRILRTIELEGARPGHDLFLNVDATLQEVTFEAMEGARGAVVVLDTRTGGLLALVSTPSFDPNSFVQGISRARYASLQDPRERPLYNRAIQGQYPPGSTIKPIVALAGLYHGVREPSEKTYCPGYYQLPGDPHRYRDWLKRGHGPMNLVDAIARSCDVYFYDLSRDLGIDRLSGFLSEFGFGRPTGIDIPNEAAGLMPTPAWKQRRRGLPWFPGETLITGIGQGFTLATPLQLAEATLILANRGVAVVPRVVGQIENPNTQVASDRPIAERRVVPLTEQAWWDEVIAGMAEVVHGERGTARGSARGAPYRYAGKTGTAQLFQIAQDETLEEDEVPEHLKDHALFIALAPLDAPEVALAVMVENGGSGSRAAAPVARKVLDHYFGEPIAVSVVEEMPENRPAPHVHE